MADFGKIPNKRSFRKFLLCNKLAEASCMAHGWVVKNFALTIIEESDGKIGNRQMNVFFYNADEVVSDLLSEDPGEMEGILDEDGISMEVLAEITDMEMNWYYENYLAPALKV